MTTANNDLIEKYLDGTTSPEEFAAFEERLRTDPALRLALLQEAGFESQLRILLKATPVMALRTDAPEAGIRIDGNQATRLSKTIPWRPAWIMIPVAAAAVALLLAVVLPLIPQRHNTQFAVRGGNASKTTIAVVANIAHPIANQRVATINVKDPAVVADAHATPDTHTNVKDPQPARPLVDPATASGNPVAQAVPRTVAPDSRVAVNPLLHSGSAVDMAPVNPGTPATVAVRPQAEGQFASVNGNVFMTRAAGAGKVQRAVQSGDSILSGDTIATGPLSGGTLRCRDGSFVRLYGNTQLTLNQMDRSRSMLLAGGAIDLRVQTLGPGNNFTVRTPYVEARVVGTEFRVMTDAKGSWVGVKTGRVEVVRSGANGEVVLVDPGCFASSYRGQPPASMADPGWRGKSQEMTGTTKYP